MVKPAYRAPAPEGNLGTLVNKIVAVHSLRKGIDSVTNGLVIRKFHEYGTSEIKLNEPEAYEFMQVGILVYGYHNDIWWFPRSVLRFYAGDRNNAPYAIIRNASLSPMTPCQIDHVKKRSSLDGIWYDEFSQYLAAAGIQPPTRAKRSAASAINS